MQPHAHRLHSQSQQRQFGRSADDRRLSGVIHIVPRFQMSHLSEENPHIRHPVVRQHFSAFPHCLFAAAGKEMFQENHTESTGQLRVARVRQ